MPLASVPLPTSLPALPGSAPALPGSVPASPGLLGEGRLGAVPFADAPVGEGRPGAVPLRDDAVGEGRLGAVPLRDAPLGAVPPAGGGGGARVEVGPQSVTNPLPAPPPVPAAAPWTAHRGGMVSPNGLPARVGELVGPRPGGPTTAVLDAPPLAPVRRPPEQALAAEATPEPATTEETEAPAKWERTGLEWTAIIAGALVAALLIKVFVFQAFVIPSQSMETTLLIHDRVLVNKLSYHLHGIERGDIVVFKRPETAKDGVDDSDLIKRVIGLPGERIEGRDEQILINGVPLKERWLPRGEVPTMFDFGPVTIPKGMIYVLGDNRDDSRDSRFIGPVPTNLVVGRAFIRWWPLNRAGGL